MSGLSRRTLSLLGVTVLAAALAIYALQSGNGRLEDEFEPRLMFPELATRGDDVARIVVSANKDQFEIERRDGAWLLPARDGFPASPNVVRNTILSLSRMQLVERKTALAERHQTIGLVAPAAGGDAVEIALQDEAGSVLAALLVGNVERGGGSGQDSTYFVRYPGDDQTWLARTTLQVEDDVVDWLDRNIVSITRDEIQSVRISLPNAQPYRLERPSFDVTDFSLAEIPEGRTPMPAFTLNATAFALAGLSITDVKKVADIEFSDPVKVSCRTFDGVLIDIELVKSGEDRWMRLTATEAGADQVSDQGSELTADIEESAPQEPIGSETSDDESATEDAVLASANEDAGLSARIAALNQRVSGWAFQIPAFKYDQLAKPLEDLLEPLDETGGSAP